MSVVKTFGDNLQRARGKAVSHATRVKIAHEIPQVSVALKPGPPQAIKGAVVRMKDGDPMQFFTDGSLRHVMGHKPGKAARKALKRARRRLR